GASPPVGTDRGAVVAHGSSARFSSPSHEGLLETVGVATTEGCSVVISALYARLSFFEFSLSLSENPSSTSLFERSLSHCDVSLCSAVEYLPHRHLPSSLVAVNTFSISQSTAAAILPPASLPRRPSASLPRCQSASRPASLTSVSLRIQPLAESSSLSAPLSA
ncbi:hypothetical protein HN51_069227, partial [Arachis hypogaea]